MICSKIDFHERKVQNQKYTLITCPYCHVELAGPSTYAVYRHVCNGDIMFFMNGHLFAGVPEYNYTESNSTWKEVSE
jgi:hypothetical protein